jgi:hypothetical protein
METSAKEATNVTLAFDRLFHEIFKIVTKDSVSDTKHKDVVINRGKVVTSEGKDAPSVRLVQPKQKDQSQKKGCCK